MDQDGEKMDVCNCINILVTLSPFLFVFPLFLYTAMIIVILREQASHYNEYFDSDKR